MTTCLTLFSSIRISFVRSLPCLLITGLAAAASSQAQAQVAAWTDSRLTVRDHIAFWMDASTITTPNDSDLVREWKDGSGANRNLVQREEKSCPQLVKIADQPIVRFDGQDDFLRIDGTGLSCENATIFIVAAPHENPGEFRGFLAASRPGERDYESGLTIDLGPGPSLKFDQLNIEGKGFGGAEDLLDSAVRFGTLHTVETIVDAGAKNVRLVVDGKPSGTRPFTPTSLSFDALTVGARAYTNGPGAQQVRGHVKADLAEVLIYDRVLSTSESELVRKYLSTKYAKLAEELPNQLTLEQAPGIELMKPEHPPDIQMLIPGFTVEEIPLSLTNVNNVRYRADGALVTLGYNGDIHLLRDTDGDGLEDKADLFWKNEGSLRGPIGLLLTPPGYEKGSGVFVPSKGKVSLIVDQNGDDQADQEIIVASGWKEIPQNVDAVGIAMDKQGNLYFGLGTANFANAYLVDEAGRAAYDLNSDRGTVQKVSADFSKRETVCTGIRFPIAFGFNQDGELFCTEQEGATWLPNGNPLDELLHIQPGRHYGFPPRHPRHNPNVIDEPSTFDYSPQHQSTCGMVFNEPVNGGPVFGPAAWRNDALVCGESRGKIWRTTLVNSPAGYVAATQLIACLQLLTVDACVAPNGDLVVACHSGPPDWGTGPTGIGKLYRIRMSEPEAPRPVVTWAEGKQEIRIAFDRPLDATRLGQLAERIRVEYGEHVRAADRFENLMPPYAVVQAQRTKPRFELPVTGATVTNDLRTLIIHTAPMTENVHYAVTLPSGDPNNPDTTEPGGPQRITQHPQADVDLTLSGIIAEWTPEGAGAPVWSGWLPHVDLAVSRALLSESALHAPLWTALQETSGRLTLRTKLNLRKMLRPAIQPGATIDYEWPAENVTLTLTSGHGLVVEASSSTPEATTEIPVLCNQTGARQHSAVLTTSGDAPEVVDTVITVQTDGKSFPTLTAATQTNEDATLRPLPLHRFLLPWIRTSTADSGSDAEPERIAELDGGSWSRGRKVFRSEAAGCFKCHAVGGGAAMIGPDLGNLVHRDYASVLRDVSSPGFSINPDFISHVVALNDGRVLTGVLRSEGDRLLLGDEKGTVTSLARSEIDTMKPSASSVMPADVTKKLSAEQLTDLLTYLLTRPPHMPLDSPLTAPPLRTPAEVTEALSGAPQPPETKRPLNIVLVDGPKDHGPGEHDYPAWKRVWEELLMAADNVSVSTAHEFPSEEQLATADVVLFFQKGSFSEQRPAKLDEYLQRGGGAVYIHWAVNGNDQVTEFSKRIGYASWGGKISFRHGPLTLDIHNTDHPIVRNFEQLQLYDESYWKLTGRPEDVTLLATSTEDGTPTPQMWVAEKGRGRVFVSIPGHYSWTFDDPLFRILMLRGIAWTAKEPVDRFNDLVPIGARMSR